MYKVASIAAAVGRAEHAVQTVGAKVEKDVVKDVVGQQTNLVVQSLGKVIQVQQRGDVDGVIAVGVPLVNAITAALVQPFHQQHTGFGYVVEPALAAVGELFEWIQLAAQILGDVEEQPVVL